MSRSLTRVGQPARRAGELDAVGGRVRAQRLDDRRRRSSQRLAEQHARRGLLGRRRPRTRPAPTPRTSGRSPCTSRSCWRLGGRRAAPSSESMPSSSNSRRARLGPRPGQPRHVDQAGRELAAQLLERRDRPGVEQRLELLLERLADARQLGDAALARQRRDRASAPRARPWPRCGRRARGARPRRRARRGRPSSSKSAAMVAFGGSAVKRATWVCKGCRDSKPRSTACRC